MKWISLSLVSLLGAMGNIVILEHSGAIGILASLVLNLLIISLMAVWWFGYFALGSTRSRGLIASHGLFMLSVGTVLVGAGGVLAISGHCEGLISADAVSHRAHLASYVQSLGYCRELGFLLALIGLCLAYPSVRLFKGIRHGTSGPPSAPDEI